MRRIKGKLFDADRSGALILLAHNPKVTAIHPNAEHPDRRPRRRKVVNYDRRRLQGVTVYREAERTVAVGDRVQFSVPFRTQKIANREMGTIIGAAASQLGPEAVTRVLDSPTNNRECLRWLGMVD